jgi:protein O-mannosyl-transferase
MGSVQADTVPPMVPFRWSPRDTLLAGALALAAVGIYLNSLPNDFVYDDRPICLDDPRTRDLSHLRDLFTESYWAGSSSLGLDLSADRLDPIYRPVTLLSLALNHAVTGNSAAGYRLVNLLLHAGVSVGVYVLCLIFLRRVDVAVIAALVFAVHPVHTEAVVPIVGRSELLAAVTVVWALVLHAQDALRGGSAPLTWRYLLTIVLFFIGVFSKESAITFIGLAVAADIGVRMRGGEPIRSVPWRRYLSGRLIRRYLGLLGVVLIFLMVRRAVVGHLFSSPDLIPPTLNVLVTGSPLQRVLTCLLILGTYVRLLFIPYPLCYDYSSPAIELQNSLWSGPVLFGLASAVVLVAALIASMRRRQELAVAVVFFLVTYSVASNLVFRIGVVMAERLIYLPSVAACMGGALVLAAVRRKWPRRVGRSRTAGDLSMVAAVIVLVGAYGFLTLRRNTVWRDNQALYLADLKAQPRSHKCWLNLGLLRFTKNDPGEGMRCLREAVRLAPNSYDALAHLGWECIRMGRREEGEKYLQQAERYRWPTETYTLWIRADLAQQSNHLAEAVSLYRKVLDARPDHQIALVNLTAICADPDSGPWYDLGKAYDYAKRAASLPAPQPQSVVALADVCVKRGRNDEARATIARGLSLLAAYRARAREMGKLAEQGPLYDKLEAGLRTLLSTLNSPATRPTSQPH